MNYFGMILVYRKEKQNQFFKDFAGEMIVSFILIFFSLVLGKYFRHPFSVELLHRIHESALLILAQHAL